MKTILIIDGEPLSLSQLRGMLEDRYRFEIASSGAEARRIVEDRGCEIMAILLDWVLPDVDGVELLRWLKSHPSLTDVEVVVESTEFVPEAIRAGIDCGAYYYLTKPFVRTQLRAIVRAAIGACELRRALARKIDETENTIELLNSGAFYFQTLKEAELLSVHLCSSASDPMMGIALMELLINAVEHGNLEISYEEKGEHRALGTFEEEVERRLKQPEFRDRRVKVEVERRGDHLEVEITDAGPGFDFERYRSLDKERMFHSHGRGILIAGANLELEYLEPGNRVRVKIPTAQDTEPVE